eukprot:448052_1
MLLIPSFVDDFLLSTLVEMGCYQATEQVAPKIHSIQSPGHESHQNESQSKQKTPPTEMKDNIDSSIFDQQYDESKDIFIKRLSTALKYYSQLDIINNNKHKDLFM